MLGAAVRIGEQRVEPGGHLDHSGARRDQQLPAKRPGARRLGRLGQGDALARTERAHPGDPHPLAVVADRQARLDRVARAVGAALDAEPHDDLAPLELPRGVERGRRHRDGEGEARRGTLRQRDRELGRRFELQTLDADLRARRAPFAFDDPADARRLEAISRAYEAWQRGLQDDRLAHLDAAGRVPETFRAGDRLGAHEEVREVVRQGDRDGDPPRGGDDHGGRPERHRLEVLAHRLPVEERPLLRALAAAG